MKNVRSIISRNKRNKFLVGWGATAQVQGFGEPTSTKSQMLNLIRSIRTVAKSKRFYVKSTGVEITNLFFLSSSDIPEHCGNNIQTTARMNNVCLFTKFL